MSPVLLIIVALLIVPFAVFYLAGRITGRPELARWGGVLGLSLDFAFFGVGHFILTRPMTEMLPSFIPYREFVIYGTGVLELALAVALLVPRLRRAAGWACIAVLVGFFPANVYAAFNQLDFGGHVLGPVYLLIRGPIQILLIFWAWWFAARRREPVEQSAVR